MDACFAAFDKDGDGHLCLSEFELICRALFRNDRGKVYTLEENQLSEIYSIFDWKGDGQIDKEEFEVSFTFLHVTLSTLSVQLIILFKDKNENFSFIPLQVCWNRWIKTCCRPKNAFLIVDVQNDFITGSLNIKQCAAQHDGSEVIEPINRLLETVNFDAVFYSLDWHPVDHVSFIDNLHLR